MMKRYFLQKIGLVMGIFFVVACSFPPVFLSEAGQQVQLFYEPEEFPQCFFINEFEVMALAAQGNSYQQALNKIKNQIALYEGTHLKINTADTTELVTVITGAGYRCPPPEDGNEDGDIELQINPTLF